MEYSNVTNMEGIFSKCKMLLSLPDLAKWNLDNVEEFNNMFKDCDSLSNKPSIIKWKISDHDLAKKNNSNSIISSANFSIINSSKRESSGFATNNINLNENDKRKKKCNIF